MAKKDYGKTASGKPITDDLVDELAKKAEAGYDVEETFDGAWSTDPWLRVEASSPQPPLRKRAKARS